MTLFSTDPAVNYLAAAITFFAAIFFWFALIKWRDRLVLGRGTLLAGFLALWYVCQLESSWTDNVIWEWGALAFAALAFIYGLLFMRGLVFRE